MTTFIDDVTSGISSITSSDAFKTGTSFLKQLNGYNSSVRADELADTSYEVQLQSLGSSRAAALSAFQFNTIVERENLSSQIDAIRLNRDEIISRQRAEVSARGLTNSRTGLLFINETMNRAERAVLDLKDINQNRRRAQELQLTSTLADIQAKETAANITKQRSQVVREERREDDTFDLIEGGLSVVKSIASIFE